MNVIKDLKISEEDYGYARKRTDHVDYVYATREEGSFVLRYHFPNSLICVNLPRNLQVLNGLWRKGCIFKEGPVG